MLLYSTFLGSITVRMWSNLGMSWGSSCSLLSISQVQLIFPITMLFPTLYYQFIFFNYSKKGLWPKRNFAASLTKDFTCLQLNWGTSLCVKWSQTLSPGLQNLPSRHCHQSFQLENSSNQDPASPRVSQQAEIVLGQQNLLLLELKATLSSMSTEANHSSLPSVDKST